jgi:hypothetical protein
MIRNILGATFGLALAVTASSASQAALIWSDEFSRSSSNSVGNGWTEIEDDSNDVGIVFNNYLLLRDRTPSAAAYQSGISTVGYENITVEFRWRPWDSDAADTLSFVYQAQPVLDWTLGFITDLGISPETYQTASFALDLAAGNTETLDIGFILNATYKKDAAKIDYVRIYGDEMTGGGGNSIPEPSGIALFGLGIVGLGFAARRRSRG